MKSTVFFLLFTIPHLIIAQAFISPDKTWNVFETKFLYPQGQVMITNILKFKEDTTINTVSYTKLYKSPDSTLINWELCGLCREESNRVFKWDDDLQTEILLYDFNLVQGDSIIIQDPYHFEDSLAIKVDTVEYTSYFGFLRKTIQLTVYGFFGSEANKCYEDTWIEGIGSIYGLLRFVPYCWIGVEHEELLLCVYDTSGMVFQSEMASNFDCYIASGSGIEENAGQIVTVFPNPAKDILHIDGACNSVIEIYSITGQLQKTLVSTDEKTLVSLSGFTNGIYIVKIINTSGSTSKMIQVKMF